MIPAQEQLTALVSSHLNERWREAFTAIPRELFVPDRALWVRGSREKTPIDRARDPDTWARAVYSDDFIITQVDNGTGDTEGAATSSTSMPSIMLAMLNHLDAHEGQTVLEIGTGTGYNAALLARRLGAANVVSIEIDPDIAQRAKANLAKAGQQVTVITGDGAAGYPPRAPYDRIIATCSVETVPWQWVAQTRPGGVIVTPWGPPMANDHLLRFQVGHDGAVGTIVDSVSFMRLRAQRWHVNDEPENFPAIATRSSADIDPHEVLGNHSALAVALHLGECRAIFEAAPATGEERLWLLARNAWACVCGGQVLQTGARRLWDEAVRAYQWWVERGRPDRQQFHLTVTHERQWVWLNDPTNIVTPLARACGAV